MQRLTRTTARVLAVLLHAPTSWRYGYDLMKDADLAAGTLYPLLARLVDDGWLESRWEESPLAGRPPRHLYRLTASGRTKARAAVSEANPAWVARLRPQGG